jgi:hypothetical protein
MINVVSWIVVADYKVVAIGPVSQKIIHQLTSLL